MTIVYSRQAPPRKYAKSLFLAGPTPRSANVASWRPAALQILEAAGFDGVVFVAEDERGDSPFDYVSQYTWEDMCLARADCILFWVDRDMKTLPGFTTNVEFGRWENSGKVVFGAPKGTPKNRYLEFHAKRHGILINRTLEETIKSALNFIGPGAQRQDGECAVPLGIWRTDSFQRWYKAQRSAGNRLDGGRVVWNFRVGERNDKVFFWAFHADVYVAAEERHKTNEVVIGRPDVASVLMYRKGSKIEDTKIVVIREFRSPSSCADGFVWELPGGSQAEQVEDFRQLAADEVAEETGLRLEPRRLISHGARPLNATVTSHQAHLYSIEISEDEMDWLEGQFGKPHGLSDDSELTYVHVMTLAELISSGKGDWATLGQVLHILHTLSGD